MGPISRYAGSLVPNEELIWQDPVPAASGELINDSDITQLKASILSSGLSISQLVFTAWSSAASYRHTDKRGGANGARIQLAPQKDWAANDPEQLASNLEALRKVQSDFNSAQSGGKEVSLADLIVLGGCAAVEAAAKAAGTDTTVPFTPGRTDATEEQTDAESFAVLEPAADAFRNYANPEKLTLTAEAHLIDRAQMLNLTAPEMTVLLGGLRVLNANTGQKPMGVLTDTPEVLSNDFFVNLLEPNIKWEKSAICEHFFEGKDAASGSVKWTATAVDLIFGSNSQLRALAEVYACDDAKETFVHQFIHAWDKVMNADRFDIA